MKASGMTDWVTAFKFLSGQALVSSAVLEQSSLFAAPRISAVCSSSFGENSSLLDGENFGAPLPLEKTENMSPSELPAPPIYEQ